MTEALAHDRSTGARAMSMLAAGASILVGSTVLIGWFLDLDGLRAVIPDVAPMKPNTALCLAALGVSILLEGDKVRVVRIALATVATALAMLTLGEYVFDVDLGIDEAIHADDADRTDGGQPGRMSVPSALAVASIGASILLARGRTSRWASVGQVLALGAVVICLLSLAGRLYAVPSLYGSGVDLTPMPLPTAITLGALALGSAVLRTDVGFVRPLADPNLTGRLGRRLLLVAVLVPLALAWARLRAQQADWIELESGVASYAVANVVVFCGMAWFITRSLLRAEAARLRAEEERDELSARMLQTERLESLGQLAGGIAHDFNNLLGVIVNMTTILEQDADDEQTVEDIGIVRDAADRGVTLTRQLLAFSRRGLEPSEVIDVNATAASLLDLVERTMPSNLRWVRSLGPDLWPVVANTSQLEQVLMNLLVNARDAMPHGGTMTVETSSWWVEGHGPCPPPDLEPGRYVRVAVADSGVGMPEEVLRHAFEPFFTTKGAQKGTGLGLATVYGIVTQAGGTVEIQSTPTVGTTVELLLPASSEEHRIAAPSSSGPVARSGRGETILVVEDDPGILSSSQRILSDHGYEVRPAGSAEEALTVWAAGPDDIDLLVSDVMLPRMSGADLARRLHEDRPDLRVLFVSGYTGDVLERADLSPEVQLLAKPVPVDVLLAKVAELLHAGSRGT